MSWRSKKQTRRTREREDEFRAKEKHLRGKK